MMSATAAGSPTDGTTLHLFATILRALALPFHSLAAILAMFSALLEMLAGSFVAMSLKMFASPLQTIALAFEPLATILAMRALLLQSLAAMLQPWPAGR